MTISLGFGFFIAFVWLLIAGGCTTFYENSSSVNRACRSGVESYSDGTTEFKCKPDVKESPTSDSNEPHNEGGRR